MDKTDGQVQCRMTDQESARLRDFSSWQQDSSLPVGIAKQWWERAMQSGGSHFHTSTPAWVSAITWCPRTNAHQQDNEKQTVGDKAINNTSENLKR